MKKVKKTGKKRDINELAAAIVAVATSEIPEEEDKPKNAAAVELGRLGGLKGGKPRVKESLCITTQRDRRRCRQLKKVKKKYCNGVGWSLSRLSIGITHS